MSLPEAEEVNKDDKGAGSPVTTANGQPHKSKHQLLKQSSICPTLCHMDFWPLCLTPALRACDATFETFNNLVGRANRWLGQFRNYELIFCETLEKKVIYVRDIYDGSMFFQDEDGPILATNLKGLRLWYTDVSGSFVQKDIAFFDTIPVYLNPGERHPKFESLALTVKQINNHLIQKPLQGQILSVETVILKIPEEDWSEKFNINPNQCNWFDEFNTHQISFIRIFYLIGPPSHELIGLEDFTPNTLDEGGILHPAKYSSFSALVVKAGDWIRRSTAICVRNIQTLETKHRKKSENHGERFDTGKMFEFKIEDRFRAYYLRVGYVMPMKDGSGSEMIYPRRLLCQTHLPLKTLAGYENITEVLARVQNDLEMKGISLYHIETVAMPEWMAEQGLWHTGERTFFDGEWYFVPDADGNDHGPYRYTLLYAVRLYYKGRCSESSIVRTLSINNSDQSCCYIM